MPAGPWQRSLWQHQLALNNQQGQAGIQAMAALVERQDLLPGTRQRIEESIAIARESLASIESLLAEVGITPVERAEFTDLNLGPISEYYHHILQDWAWDDGVIQQRAAAILSLFKPEKSGNVLALGAGAGRLSWELHQHWNAEMTIACDINPLLLATGHKLIVKQEGFDFYELNSFPQIGKARSARYRLPPPAAQTDRAGSWHALAADVWRMPIKPNSMDLLLTAWFIDVHGGDNRDLIGLIHRWLKPGGRWINSGPLLYPKNTPIECKYEREELLALMAIAGFSCEQERLDQQHHLMSPINVRQQTEQVWTFCAQKTQASAPAAGHPPAWLLFHDLPVPRLATLPSPSHPLVDKIIAMVDGERSIAVIAAQTASLFPAGLDPVATIVEILGELIRGAD
jgi:hypothetical protein